MPTPQAPVGRLAPSPTGKLHLGHARSFLLAYWSIRSRGGRLLLRMEDLDVERCRPEFADGVLRDLEWLGLDWDGEPLWQSKRLELYLEAAERLEQQAQAYACVCSRRDIQEALSAPQEGVGAASNANTSRLYPGTCKGLWPSRDAAQKATDKESALRFALPQVATIEFADAFAGPQCFDLVQTCGDFPILRRDGLPAYQLAVALDDGTTGITEVLRGEDLLESTARQLLLFEALGMQAPKYLHVPLVTDAEGRRLAKRCDDLSLAELREQGVDPRAVVKWAANSCGMSADELIHASEFTPDFDLGQVPNNSVDFSGF